MSEKSSKSEIPAILEGTVEEVTASLADASAQNLILLVEAEKSDDGEKRKGVIEAIVAEQNARTELAKEQISAAVEAAEHAGMFLAVFTSEDDFEDPGKSEHLKTRVAELETALTAKEEAEKTTGPKPKKPKKQRELSVNEKALPVIDALAFVGRDGRTIKDLPDLSVKPRQLKNERGGKTLMAEIVFPETPGKPIDLHAVYALDANGKAISVCNLVAPFPVGVGEATFAPGSIHFPVWPQEG